MESDGPEFERSGVAEAAGVDERERVDAGGDERRGVEEGNAGKLDDPDEGQRHAAKSRCRTTAALTRPGPDEATRRRETERFIDDLRKAWRALKL